MGNGSEEDDRAYVIHNQKGRLFAGIERDQLEGDGQRVEKDNGRGSTKYNIMSIYTYIYTYTKYHNKTY